MEMDLSWCIICDKRIMDDELTDSSRSLYCSLECQLKDQSKSIDDIKNDSIYSDTQQQLNHMPTQAPETIATHHIEPINTNTSTQQQAYSSLYTALEKVKPWMSKKAAKQYLYKTNNPSATAYPWVPTIHRRRRNYLTIPRRCVQPTVASSITTANGILSS